LFSQRPLKFHNPYPLAEANGNAMQCNAIENVHINHPCFHAPAPQSPALNVDIFPAQKHVVAFNHGLHPWLLIFGPSGAGDFIHLLASSVHCSGPRTTVRGYVPLLYMSNSGAPGQINHCAVSKYSCTDPGCFRSAL